MYLSQLISQTIAKYHDVQLKDLTLDSRKVKAGDAFIAIKGTKADGSKYIDDAIQRGALAIFVDAESNSEMTFKNDVAIVPIKNLKEHVSEIAARFYGYPAKSLKIIGVTGTSGKTSCTHFLAQILDGVGIRCGIIGTLGNGFYNELDEAELTTPDAVSLQKLLREFVAKGAKAVAMEVSSHSIHQCRIANINFEVGIFTNISQDHLDYHGDMETYARVKYSFLESLNTKQAIINADDAYGLRWINEISQHKPVYAYSMHKPQPSFEKVGLGGISQEKILSRFVYVDQSQLSLHDIHTYVRTPWGMGELVLPLIGLFNVSNALAVITAACVCGVSFKEVMQRISSLTPVPGRMQTIFVHGQPLVIVDYAHKPDALEKVLQTLRPHTKGKLICVFGCGGDRDHSKRPIMAQIAEQLADEVIITNDNPRYEDPEVIVQEIMRGFAHPEKVIVELDRSKAILKSIQSAQVGDCILIAGKGAEHYQQIGDNKVPFDDAEQVKNFLSRSAIRVSGEI